MYATRLKSLVFAFVALAFCQQASGQIQNEEMITGKLFWAINNYDSTALLNAIEEGANVNFVLTGTYDTPLITASRANNWFAVKTLLDRGADPNEFNDEGVTPLILACGNNNIPIAYLLLQKNADPKIGTMRDSSLMDLIENRRQFFVKNLIQNPTKYYGIYKTLGQFRKFVNNKSQTEIIDYLKKIKDKDLNLQGLSGETFLHLAAFNDLMDVIKYLLDRGSDYAIRDYRFGFTPIEVAFENLRLTSYALLFQKGARIDKEKPKILDYAEKIAKIDSDPLKNFFENPDLNQYASQLEIDQMFTAIRRWKFNLGDGKYDESVIKSTGLLGNNAMHAAAIAGNLRLIRQLDSLGLEVNQQNEFGQTPLTYAINNRNAVVAKLLVDLGADASTSDNNGLTSIDLARRNGMTRLASELRSTDRDASPEIILQDRLRPETVAFHSTEKIAAVSDGLKKINLWDLNSKLIYKKIELIPADTALFIQDVKFLIDGQLAVKVWSFTPQNVLEKAEESLEGDHRYVAYDNYGRPSIVSRQGSNPDLSVDPAGFPIIIHRELIYLVDPLDGTIVEKMDGRNIHFDGKRQAHWLIHAKTGSLSIIKTDETKHYPEFRGLSAISFIDAKKWDLLLGFQDGTVEWRDPDNDMNLIESFQTDLTIIREIYPIDENRAYVIGGYEDAPVIIDKRTPNNVKKIYLATTEWNDRTRSFYFNNTNISSVALRKKSSSQ